MRGTILALIIVALALGTTPLGEAHVTGGIVKIAGKYRIQFIAVPSPANPGEEVSLIFSVQDLEGNNLRNVGTDIKIMLDKAIHFDAGPKVYQFGDFQLRYVFPSEGTYKVVIDIINDGSDASADFDVLVSRSARLFQELISYAMIIAVSVFGVALVAVWIRDRKKATASIPSEVLP